MLVSDIKVLSAGDIATALDRTEELYDVPEWGGAVKLRPLSLAQRDELTKKSTVNGQTDGATIVRLLVVYGVVEPVLTDDILKEKAYAVVDRIAKKIMELNGLTQEAPLTAARTF
jgi:hypothetical protein